MTRIERWDYVLNSFCTNAFIKDGSTDSEIDKYINPGNDLLRNRIIPMVDLIPILYKLVKDGHLHSELNEQKVAKYSITAEGREFSRIGGYENIMSLENERLKNVAQNAELVRLSFRISQATLVLTCVLAGAALVASWYYLTEIWKYYHLHFCHCH